MVAASPHVGIPRVDSLASGSVIARPVFFRISGVGTTALGLQVKIAIMIRDVGDGTITVLSLGTKPKILAVNDMGAGTYATPAIVNGTLYVRTHTKLFAFGLRP